MSYTKEDARMTQGLAIVCMVALHLFCRQGEDVLGTPLLWLNETTPLVYSFGFFAEICVPLYTICIGYAQELLLKTDKSSFPLRLKRIGRLMFNYWVVLVIFSVIGLIVNPMGNIPGSVFDFIKATILLKSYNGAWWFLHTYIFLLLLPPKWLLFPVNKCKPLVCIALCITLYGTMYFADRYNLTTIPQTHPVLEYVLTEFFNVLGVLSYVWLGALMCKCSFMERIKAWWDRVVSVRFQKLVLLVLLLVIFVSANLLHKALLMGPVAVAVFLIFNLWQKSHIAKKIWLFLGEHSTNIWLVHMFFYAYIFVGLIEIVQIPILMLLFMFVLCITASYIIKATMQACIVLYHCAKKAFSNCKDC